MGRVLRQPPAVLRNEKNHFSCRRHHISWQMWLLFYGLFLSCVRLPLRQRCAGHFLLQNRRQKR